MIVKIHVTNIVQIQKDIICNMPTQSALNKSKTKLKYLYSKSQMLLIKFKDSGDLEYKQRYFDVLDTLDIELDKYYSNYMMFLKVEEKVLFETYLMLKKESVKQNLLSELFKEWKIEKENAATINEMKFNIHTELKS